MIVTAEFLYKEFQRNRKALALYRLRNSSCALCGAFYVNVLGKLENSAASATERLLQFVKSTAI